MQASKLSFRSGPTIPSLGIYVLALGCLGLSACASTGAGHRAGALSRLEAAGIVRPDPDCHQQQAALDRVYDEAIRRSAVFLAEHQVNDLRAVTGAATMGSFLSCAGCGDPASTTCSKKCKLSPGKQTAPGDIWVSFGDQVQSFCQQFPTDQLVLRMQQLQGLPPNLCQPIEDWKVLVLEIDGPSQLFRPCTDSDPTTTGPCTEKFPCDDTCQTHRSWLAGQAFSSWQIPDGYPWTRLGYTYNWNPEAPTFVGTSEFVIPAGTRIEVVELAAVTDYCAPPP